MLHRCAKTPRRAASRRPAVLARRGTIGIDSNRTQQYTSVVSRRTPRFARPWSLPGTVARGADPHGQPSRDRDPQGHLAPERDLEEIVER